MSRTPKRLALLGVLVIALAGAQFSSSSNRSPGEALESSLLFHPVKATEGWIKPPASLHVEDVWLRSTDGTPIHAWWLPSQGSQGAILFCHGNAGNLSYWTPVTETVSSTLSQSILIFDYPGYGRSGGKPSEAGCYAAADAVYDWLVQKQHISPEQIILFGESLGGGVATDLAVRRPHRALILVKTFTSIPDMARKGVLTSASAALVKNQFDNLAKIGRCAPPIFIAHGDHDRIIPLSQGQELFESAPRPKQFFLLKGCDHNDPYPPEFFAALRKFLG
jgi:fermentation-respiration switch protein FrsA (DUF1100 family)